MAKIPYFDFEEDLGIWKQANFSVKTQQQAKELAREPFVYSIRMLWLGRYDKLSIDLVTRLDAASKLYLPYMCKFSGAINNEVIMQDQDHTSLANSVFEKAWQEYLVCDVSVQALKKTPKKQSTRWGLLDIFGINR